jgi:probable HAF family extracellular repeat protein
MAQQGEALSNRVDGTLKSTGRGYEAWRFSGVVGSLAEGTVSSLGTLRDDDTGFSEGVDINDSGQVAGSAEDEPAKGNDNVWAIRDDEVTGMLSLGTLATTRDWNDSTGRGLNNHGDVVGMSLDGNFPNERAFLYTDDDGLGMLDLTQLTDGVPADVMSGDYFVPRDINNSGDIGGPYVDNGNFSNGVPKAFLLIRVPAP